MLSLYERNFTMSIQTLAADFFSNLISSETGNDFSLTEYFSNPCSENYPMEPTLPDLLCYQQISVSAPFSYMMKNLNVFCLILTTKGEGQLEYHEQLYSLDAGSFVFMDCRLLHRISCPRNRWEYMIGFVTIPVTEIYYAKCCPNHNCFFALDPYTELPSIWNQLLQKNQDSELHALLRSRTLIQLYTELYLSRKKENSEDFHIPTYLLDLKKTFDTACDEPFSLDDAARKYHINKYRLCREFSAFFQDTPLQYLNRVRIERAKELLLTTDEKICDIGQYVGIENTNHFIKLFKQKTGVTPLTFRKETPIL